VIEKIGDATLYLGDCLEVLRTLPDNSVHAVVTDPPYGLSFMGKRWDYDVPSVEVWSECLRVLKPGGHLLAFAGTRTQHRMAVRIEDAGFEIRDMIAWVYGSGFPKSLDVSKAIDKVRDWSKVERLNLEIKRARETAGLSLKQIGEAMQAATNGQYGSWYHRGGHMFFETGRNLPSRPEWDCLRRVLPISAEFQDAYNEAEREVIVTKSAARSNDGSWASNVAGGMFKPGERDYDITAPATEAAKQWQGWGTALKPALEPITVARKPLIGTVAENVLAHGTGAINVDGCRVGDTVETWPKSRSFRAGISSGYTDGIEKGATQTTGDAPPGRWPANLIHDGSDEVLRVFPFVKTGICPADGAGGYQGGFNRRDSRIAMNGGDSGSVSRFFYCAKASKSDRGADNVHPTVKPTDLMRYLCRLVTPPGGVVLDPFMGSGSTGKAACLEGFNFIGIERESQYFDIACKRIEQAVNQSHEIELKKSKQLELLD
jgi:DNA modification methylase